MMVRELSVPDVKLFDPLVFEDNRGFFFESFTQRVFDDAVGGHVIFVQDNHSVSKKGVLRGMHFQRSPFAQGKLVRVIHGAAYDVAVDLRDGSPTYGKWVAEVLTASNRRQLWIPEGFAHGFLALEDQTEVLYKATSYYSREHEDAISWKAFDIPWPAVATPILSERDAAASLSYTSVSS